jgi:hypothetical protein
MMSRGESHQKKRVKTAGGIQVRESRNNRGADLCTDCGVCVKAKKLGCNEEGCYMIPTALPDPISRGLIYLLWLLAP